MLKISDHKLAFRFGILLALSFLLWVSAGKRAQTHLKEQLIVVDVTQLQMTQPGARPAVEIKCDVAKVTLPGSLEGFRCTLKNHTARNITAANLRYSVVLGDSGQTRDVHSLTVETLIHPDFLSVSNPVRPNEDIVVKTANLSYGDVAIKALEIAIDFVEFEDGTTLGPNQKGSQIIAGMRQGAAKYKHWLIQRFAQNRRSVALLLPLLKAEKSLPGATDGVEFKNSDEETGARAYRTRLQKIHKVHGDTELEKYLRKQ